VLFCDVADGDCEGFYCEGRGHVSGNGIWILVGCGGT
jgi:hypothetical protein